MLDHDRTTSLVSYSVVLIFLSTISVIMRLISRHISAADFWWDDALIVISLLDSFAIYVIVFVDVNNGMGSHVQNVPVAQRIILLKMIYAANVNKTFGLSTIKIAILLFYLRLFGFHRCFRRVLYSTAALVTSWFIGKTFVAIFRCSPVSAAFDPDPLNQEAHCFHGKAYLVPTALLDILLDVWVLVLPLPMIWKLQLSQRQKYCLSGIFLLGAFTIGSSIAGAYYSFKVNVWDMFWSSVTLIDWSNVEISVAIISACLPTMQPVFRVMARKLVETNPFSNTRANRSSNVSYQEPPAGQARGTSPSPDEKMNPPRLSLGNVSWLAPDYEGFGYDDPFKEFREP